jgi:hypothetical protein
LLYCWNITITAGRTESAPTEQSLKLQNGVITYLSVKFPKGCKNLVEVKLFRWTWQMLPFNRDSWLTGDDETVIDEPFYELDTEPYFLTFKGAAPSATYDHVITVRVRVLPKLVAMPFKILERILERMGLL